MKVIIVGGGNVGTYIANELVVKNEVWLLELDPEPAYVAPERSPFES